jgi:hypothetical protein
LRPAQLGDRTSGKCRGSFPTSIPSVPSLPRGHRSPPRWGGSARRAGASADHYRRSACRSPSLGLRPTTRAPRPLRSPLLERFKPHPSPASASEWLRNIGGEAAAGMLAQAAGFSATSIVRTSSERGALVTIKHLRSIAATELVGSFGAAPSSLVTSDELWQGLRPLNWEDAAARAQEVAQAADVRRSNMRGAAAYPGAMHAAHAGPLFAHAPPHPVPLAAAAPADTAALGAALRAAMEGSSTRRPGEVNGYKTTSYNQRQSRT